MDGVPPELDTVGRTPEERERLAAARAALADLPEGVEVGEVGFLSEDDQLRQIHKSEAAVFVKAEGYSWWKGGGPTMPPIVATVEVSGLGYVESAVRSGRARATIYGIATELAGMPMPLSAYVRLQIAPSDGGSLCTVPLYIDISEGDEKWKSWALRRFAIVWPPGEDGKAAWLATGPLHSFAEGVTVAGDLGRNDPCPCGSGVKFKRCHGR